MTKIGCQSLKDDEGGYVHLFLWTMLLMMLHRFRLWRDDDDDDDWANYSVVSYFVDHFEIVVLHF